jgi:hypothetical protein
MNVVMMSNIYSQIIQAIRTSEENNTVIDRIELSQAEMLELISVKRATEPADDHYGAELNEWKIHNFGPAVSTKDDLPASCWIKYVKIIMV